MKLIKSTAIALSIVSCLIASDMRIGALGGNTGFWPEDDQNIMMFPSTINNFNLAQIQDASGENPYATFIFGDNTKYGFMLDGSKDNLLNFAIGTGSLGALIGFDMDSNNEWNMNGDSDSDGWNESNPSSINLNASLGIENSVGELGLGLNFTTSDNDNGNKDDDAGMLAVSANLRREQSLWVFSHLLLSANYSSGQITASDTSYYSDAVDASAISVEASLFRHWNIASQTDLLFAAGFGFNSTGLGAESVKLTETSIILPKYTFAVETNIRQWATLRAGINNSHYLSQSSEQKGNDRPLNSMGTSDTNYSVGLGLEYEGFKLDVDLNPRFFINPMPFITGFNNENLASKATITYTW